MMSIIKNMNYQAGMVKQLQINISVCMTAALTHKQTSQMISGTTMKSAYSDKQQNLESYSPTWHVMHNALDIVASIRQ